MRVALLAHLRHPIRPPFMGGMEAHSWHLARALVARGHDVTVLAPGDSEVAGRLHPVIPEGYDAAFPWARYRGTDALNRYQDDAMARAMGALRDGGFDVVHNNGLHRYPARLARTHRLPTVTSLHVPPFDPLSRVARDSGAPWSRFTVTSERQRASWWPEGAPEAAHVVHNGIDLAGWPFAPAGGGGGGGGAVWSGRIMPNKGLHLAVEAARIAGVPLTAFGAIEDEAYFDARIRPHLGGEIRYGGHLAPADLAAELGRADAFLFTPLWDEPFGLAAVEAMACGAPVAATDEGAVREVVGEAGRFAPRDAPSALARALRAALEIPRTVPRARVERHFTIERMLDGYERIYAQAMAGRDAPAPPARFPAIELRVAGPQAIAAE
jgi:glycosyltransferase involved in cell wall biosynthesis